MVWQPMCVLTPIVSIDSLSILHKNPSNHVLHGLYDGPIDLQSDSVDWVNNHINGSRFFDKTNRSRTLFHTYYHGGRIKKPHMKYSTACEEWLSFDWAGLNRHRRRHDQATRESLDFFIELIKSDVNPDYRISKLHLAFDIWTDPDITIDQFFALKFAKTDRVNSPFIYYKKNVEGSRTYYIEMKTKSGKKCIIRAYLYEKDKKEGLRGDKRLFRFEVCVGGLNKVGDDPDELIKRLEMVLKKYGLYFFKNVGTCKRLKKQYAENIRKDQSPNVPKKLLRNIGQSSTPIPLELTDEIKRFIYNTLQKDKGTKPIECEPLLPIKDPVPVVAAALRRIANDDQLKICRIRRRLSLRWKREAIERTKNRERRNKQGIRRKNDDLQRQCEPVNIQFWDLDLEGGQVFNKQDFFILSTGPPIGKHRISYLILDIPMLERQQVYPLDWQHRLLSS